MENKNNKSNSRDWLPFPTDKRDYAKTIGILREKNVRKAITEILYEFSMFPFLYEIPDKPIFSKGADVIIKIKFNNIDIAKFEVLNWKYGSSIGYQRAKEIYNNLSGCPLKGLICTSLHFYKNDEATRELLLRIPILELKYQTLPKRYYYWFKERDRFDVTDLAEYSSLDTYVKTKTKIKEFLKNIGFVDYIINLETILLTKLLKDLPIECNYSV